MTDFLKRAFFQQVLQSALDAGGGDASDEGLLR
jgi:hypothetical protein